MVREVCPIHRRYVPAYQTDCLLCHLDALDRRDQILAQLDAIIRLTASEEKDMARPNAKAPLGQGGRFAAVAKAAKAGGARNPEAVAAAVGRAKYGSKKMAALAAKGRREAK